jgi:hypothetical protein
MSAVLSTFRAHYCMHSEKSAISLSLKVLPFPTVGSLVIRSGQDTRSDPCISSVAPAIMITTSNSSVKRSRTPNQFLGVLLHTIAMSGLSRVSVWACGPLNLMKIGSSKCRIGQARSGEIEFALEKLRLSACLIRSVRG